MELQSFTSFTFNLQQFNQAACVCTQVLPCALSLLYAFLFAHLRMRCVEKEREDFNLAPLQSGELGITRITKSERCTVKVRYT